MAVVRSGVTRSIARLGSIAAVACALAAAPAAADVVAGPPSGCPSGSIGRASHYGPHCMPALCQTDAECDGGRVCREASFCVVSFVWESHRGPRPLQRFVGPCAPDGSCAEGTCDRARYCVAAPSAPVPEPDREASAPPDREASAPPDREASAPPDREASAPPDREASAPPARPSGGCRAAAGASVAGPWLLIATAALLSIAIRRRGRR